MNEDDYIYMKARRCRVCNNLTLGLISSDDPLCSECSRREE